MTFAPPAKWLALADAFYWASVDKTGGRAGIPLLWGTDAIHGHSDIIGATLFPQNVGLGAMRDPALMAKIATVTAAEDAHHRNGVDVRADGCGSTGRALGPLL